MPKPGKGSPTGAAFPRASGPKRPRRPNPACVACRKAKLKCEDVPGQDTCVRCAGLEIKCVKPPKKVAQQRKTQSAKRKAPARSARTAGTRSKKAKVRPGQHARRRPRPSKGAPQPRSSPVTSQAVPLATTASLHTEAWLMAAHTAARVASTPNTSQPSPLSGLPSLGASSSSSTIIPPELRIPLTTSSDDDHAASFLTTLLVALDRWKALLGSSSGGSSGGSQGMLSVSPEQSWLFGRSLLQLAARYSAELAQTPVVQLYMRTLCRSVQDFLKTQPAPVHLQDAVQVTATQRDPLDVAFERKLWEEIPFGVAEVPFLPAPLLGLGEAWVNKKLAQWMQYPRSLLASILNDIYLIRSTRLIHPDSFWTAFGDIWDAMASGRSHFSGRIHVRRADGQSMWLQTTGWIRRLQSHPVSCTLLLQRLDLASAPPEPARSRLVSSPTHLLAQQIQQQQKQRQTEWQHVDASPARTPQHPLQEQTRQSLPSHSSSSPLERMLTQLRARGPMQSQAAANINSLRYHLNQASQNRKAQAHPDIFRRPDLGDYTPSSLRSDLLARTLPTSSSLADTSVSVPDETLSYSRAQLDASMASATFAATAGDFFS